MSEFFRLYEQLGVAIVRKSDREASALCPFHEDTNPSFSISSEGLFRCFTPGCGKEGNFQQFQGFMDEIKSDLSVDPGIVEEAHQRLLSRQEALDWLYVKRGLSNETIKKYKLGWEPGRIWIPIGDGHGRYQNIRRHAMDAETARFGKTLPYKVGFGKVRLWPASNTTGSEIWICEGELDCLVLIQQGFEAVTGTGGAGTWKPEWNVNFVGKRVVVCYDTDKAGIIGASKVSLELSRVAKQLKILVLPVEAGHKDVTDYFVEERRTREDLVIHLDKIQAFAQPSEGEPRDETVYEMELDKASYAEMVGKKIKTKVLLCGKDLSPHTVPKDIRFTCNMGLRICVGCSIFKNNGTMQASLSKDDPQLLKLKDVNEAVQRAAIRPMVGIIPTCPRFKMEVKSYHNIDGITIMPDFEYSTDIKTQYVTRTAHYVGDGLRANQSYDAEGMVTPDPNNQYVTFLFPKMTPTKSSLDTYEVTAISMDRLKVFQATSEPFERLRDISKDLEDNVTMIHKREDVIWATDLVFHSALSFKFQDQIIERGWTEGLIIGDTRCGKTETVKNLVNHYKCGEIVSGEQANGRGLLGSVQALHKKWQITWGKIPLNDRRAVVIDEVSGMTTEEIAALSSMRSSGIAEIIKVYSERTMARTRKLWVSNARNGQSMSSFNWGVDAVIQLIGQVADVSRFDFCMGVLAKDVSIEEVNQRVTNKVKHVFTSELCRELLMWIWSRNRNQVVITPEAVEACLDFSATFSRKYSSDKFTLVERNEQRIKFARLAAAVAGRLYSTEDGKTLLVKASHVDVVEKLLTRWYDHPSLAYDEYSKVKDFSSTMTITEAMEIKNLIVPLGMPFCKSLLQYQYITGVEMQDLTGRSPADVRMLMSALLRCKAFDKKSHGYKKTPGFMEILRTIEEKDIPKLPEF